jgi:AraC family transcriptional regulator, regulatory protein of adaptative response / methylated-DNA-[protein]-cysteine methyltransferase
MNIQSISSTGTGATSSDLYWRAVLAHDSNFDRTFVYAVRSTGIYCRPSCPSRRPKREQVEFYAAPEAAERAGFRPCRRCQRRNQGNLDRSDVELVARVCHSIEEKIDELDARPTLDSLAARFGTSPHRLRRGFARLTGITPREYVDARLLQRVKAELKNGSSVTDALYAAGYGSSRSLYERAPEQLGMTPATYRKGGRGMAIRYAIVDSPLGRLLVAATERGVCSVCLGDSDSALERVLREEYPEAELARDFSASAAGVAAIGGLASWVRDLVRHLSGQLPNLDLPVDVRATAFQWRVWQELRAIPSGSTRSYSEVARALGRPKAARAVARACATNPVAVVIPCHRVVREDGDLGGYRWGLERKRKLLERESANAAAKAAAR